MRADENNDGGNDDSIINFTHDGTLRAEIRYDESDSKLKFATSDNGGHLVIDSSGRMLLGTTTEGHSSADDLTINNSGHGGITIRTGTTSNGAIFFSDATSGAAEYNGFLQYNHGSSPYLLFGAGSAERMRITDGGHVTISATSYSALTINTSNDGTNGPEIQLMHNSASPAANDTIGQIRYSGKDSAGDTTLYSKIETKVLNVNNGSEAGHLDFSTRGGGAYNSIFRLNARSTANYPSYTTDDMNGIILDTYNTGNPYPRYFNFIAKSAGNTDSNIGFWTEAVGGSPTEKMRISADGYVTKPSMPSFFVHGSPNVGQNTGYSNIAYSFVNVKHNTGSHYANNTGRFTAPVAGVYYFTGGLWCNTSDNNSGSYLLVFKKNGSEAGVGCNHRFAGNQLNASMIISLSANDIITLGFADGSGGSIQGSTPRNYFCGYLIG